MKCLVSQTLNTAVDVLFLKLAAQALFVVYGKECNINAEEIVVL